jgi:hypothetical protein
MVDSAVAVDFPLTMRSIRASDAQVDRPCTWRDRKFDHPTESVARS